MSIFYILAEKAKAGTKSGNLSSSNYGEFEANDLHFPKLTGGHRDFTMYYDKPEIKSHQILLKVEVKDSDMEKSEIKRNFEPNGIRVTTRINDWVAEANKAPSSFQIKVLSQVLPNGFERLKQHAAQEETRANKPTDLKREKQEAKAVSLMQRAIDEREKDQSKDSKGKEPPRFQQ